jgi:large subunit ribosomal protein L35
MAKGQKTNKSAAARFKISKNGKLMHRSPFARHLRSSKSKRQLRSLKQMKVVEGVMEKKIKRLLGVM